MVRKNVKTISRSKAHWSHENVGVMFTTPSEDTVNGLYQSGTIIVPAIQSQGARTISGLRISFSLHGEETNPIYYALVYVPEGETAKSLFQKTGQVNSGSVYEPNQYVMSCGVVDPDAGNHVSTSRISRRLHSGDFISLIVGSAGPLQMVSGIVSYFIKYN